MVTPIVPQPSSNAPRVPRFWWRFLLLSGLALLAYAPAIGGQFLWDDTDWIVGAEALHGWDGLRRIWLEPGAVVQYYPLTYTSWWLDVQLWGLDPWPMHVENVLLHALAATLLGSLLGRLAVPGAHLAALLFLLHPVQVESVAWLTERKNVLSGVLYLAALWAYVEYEEHGGRARWLRAGLLFACALTAKTTTVVLPVVLALILYWRRGRLTRRHVVSLLPLALMSAGAAAMTIAMERHEGAVGADWSLEPLQRLVLLGRVPWFYLGKLALPLDLAFVYPKWALTTTPAAWLPLGAWLLLFVALGMARRSMGRAPLVVLLGFWVSLLPVSGLIDFYFMRYAYVADHFQYLASLFILAAAGALVTRGWAHLVGARGHVSTLRFGPALAAILVLGPMAWRQASMYTDLESLWRGTLARNERAWMPHANLGYLLAERGSPADGLPHHRRALELEPTAFESLNALGNEHARRAVATGDAGQRELALEHYRRALEVKPSDPLTHKNLGLLWSQLGDERRALEIWEQGLAHDPDNVNLMCNLAHLLAGARDTTLRDGARAVRLAEAVTSDPAQRHAETLWLLTGAYSSAGRVADARRAAREALAAAEREGQEDLAQRARIVLQHLPLVTEE